jgi:molecular chaperone GrpE
MSNKNEEEFEDEIEFTDESGEQTSLDKIKKLKEDLKDSKEESQKNLDGWQRALADYANLQKTSNTQIKELREYSLQSFVEELLPVLDSFEMAMKNKESWEAVPENWRKGVEYIYNQLKGVISNNGIEEISNLNDRFNPEIHHAVEEIKTEDESKDHTISEVVQKGYKTAKVVIRPAQVKIFVKD